MVSRRVNCRLSDLINDLKYKVVIDKAIKNVVYRNLLFWDKIRH